VVLLVAVGVGLWLAFLVFVVVLCRAAALGDEADRAIGSPAAGRRGALRLARKPPEDDAIEGRESSRSSSRPADALRDVKSPGSAAYAEGAGDHRARARRR
jgi:hypothetical protein